MTEKSNSNVSSEDESEWTPECIDLGQKEVFNTPLTELVTKLLEPSADISHPRFEGVVQPLEEKPEYEIIEQIVGNIITSRVTQQFNSSNQNDNDTNTPQNVEQIQMEQKMNVDLNTLYGSESSYNGCIQSTESTETNLTLYRLDDSSSANSVVNYFHCPICSYRSVDRFQVQNHYYAIHEENTNCATRQGLLIFKLISFIT
nr:hypothetical transcript [Hymenolepis microstoma]